VTQEAGHGYFAVFTLIFWRIAMNNLFVEARDVEETSLGRFDDVGGLVDTDYSPPVETNSDSDEEGRQTGLIDDGSSAARGWFYRGNVGPFFVVGVVHATNFDSVGMIGGPAGGWFTLTKIHPLTVKSVALRRIEVFLDVTGRHIRARHAWRISTSRPWSYSNWQMLFRW
jgi:hypothetical protein